LTNANKFTRKGHIKIYLSLTDFVKGDENVDEKYSSKYLFVKVIDNGIGIKYKDQQKLFQPFARLEHSSKLNPNGVGLGLSNCKRVLESMGGNIWIQESRERTGFHDLNCGTVMSFTVKLFPCKFKAVREGSVGK
jgi:signal transduction histidine kinase